MQHHNFIDRRCVHCYTNDMDAEIYEIECSERDELFRYTTTSGAPVEDPHRESDANDLLPRGERGPGDK